LAYWVAWPGHRATLAGFWPHKVA